MDGRKSAGSPQPVWTNRAGGRDEGAGCAGGCAGGGARDDESDEGIGVEGTGLVAGGAMAGGAPDLLTTTVAVISGDGNANASPNLSGGVGVLAADDGDACREVVT